MRLGLTLALTIAVATPARAQWTVYDPANYAENVLHYTHQLLQINYQVQQLQAQLKAMLKLPHAPWRDVIGPLGGMAALMGGTQTLGYAAPGVGSTFATLFPVSRPVADWPVEQQTRTQRAVDVLRAALLATAQQQQAVAPGEQVIQRMKVLNAGVEGHEQALELENTAAVYSAEELMLLRQAAMAQTNIQAVYYAAQLNAESQRDVTARAVLDQLSAPPPPVADISLRVGP
jgi:P-type conjugative transfer protein TrbJ